MLGLSTPESSRSALIRQLTGPIPCDAPNLHLFTGGPKNLRAIQLLLGHTKLESTVRYLGIEVEDALELAEQTEV